MNADRNIKKVETGMTQELVAVLMGSHYEIIGANEESLIWGYKAADNIHMDAVEKYVFED